MPEKSKFKIDRKSLLMTKGVSFEFIEAYKSLRTNLQFASINNTITSENKYSYFSNNMI
jgi:hypothetical protein